MESQAEAQAQEQSNLPAQAEVVPGIGASSEASASSDTQTNSHESTTASTYESVELKLLNSQPQPPPPPDLSFALSNSSETEYHNKEMAEAKAATATSTTPARAPTPATALAASALTSSNKQVKKARKVKFYRNGDAFYEGLMFAVSSERFRTFEALLTAITDSALGDKRVLPRGVRTIFTMEGAKVSTVDELEEGQTYVCASGEAFKKLEYTRASTPSWASARTDKGRSGTAEKSEGGQGISESVAHPKFIVFLRNGVKPRKVVRLLVNQRTVHSFEQLLDQVTAAFQTLPVNKFFTLDGVQITTLKQLTELDEQEIVVLARGNERHSNEDYTLSDLEVKAVRAISKGASAIPGLALASTDGHPPSSNGADAGAGAAGPGPGVTSARKSSAYSVLSASARPATATSPAVQKKTPSSGAKEKDKADGAAEGAGSAPSTPKATRCPVTAQASVGAATARTPKKENGSIEKAQSPRPGKAALISPRPSKPGQTSLPSKSTKAATGPVKAKPLGKDKEKIESSAEAEAAPVEGAADPSVPLNGLNYLANTKENGVEEHHPLIQLELEQNGKGKVQGQGQNEGKGDGDIDGEREREGEREGERDGEGEGEGEAKANGILSNGVEKQNGVHEESVEGKEQALTANETTLIESEESL